MGASVSRDLNDILIIAGAVYLGRYVGYSFTLLMIQRLVGSS